MALQSEQAKPFPLPITLHGMSQALNTPGPLHLQQSAVLCHVTCFEPIQTREACNASPTQAPREVRAHQR
jgi:hypothetical protein